MTKTSCVVKIFGSFSQFVFMDQTSRKVKSKCRSHISKLSKQAKSCKNQKFTVNKNLNHNKPFCAQVQAKSYRYNFHHKLILFHRYSHNTNLPISSSFSCFTAPTQFFRKFQKLNNEKVKKS